jgi:hypothetical protein
MLVSMPVRCDQCGHESDPRYRFCGMCGAKLPPPPPPPPEPLAAKPEREEPMRRVSGPSFLGLAEEPSSNVTYLLEDEMSESHWGRTVVLLVILAALGAAGWHWRSEIRAYVVARLGQHPNNSGQPESTSYPGGAVSTSASETAMQTPSASTPVENQNAATSQTPASPAPAGQQPSATTNNTAASGEQANAAPEAAPSTSASSSAAPAQTGQASPTPASTSPQESAATAPPAKEPSAGEQAANERTPKAESAATKRAKSNVKETAEGKTSADEIEAEGEKYLYGTGVSPNCSRAQRDLQAAAEQGSSKADSVLGTMYATGHCVSRDLPLAYRWFAMALQHDPGNARLQDDLRVLWNQMSADERQVAMRRQ